MLLFSVESVDYFRLVVIASLVWLTALNQSGNQIEHTVPWYASAGGHDLSD